MSKEELETPPLEQHLAEVIADIIKEKEMSRIAPTHAGMQEIIERVREGAVIALRSMVRSGLLTCHKTLNGITFSFTPPK